MLELFQTLRADLPKRRILVLGDVMLDHYWHGSVKRISPEAPVPILSVNQKTTRVGGAANVALNLRILGAEVTLMGLVGKDEDAKLLRTLLEEHGVTLALQDGLPRTTSKIRMITASGQQIVRIDEEAPLSEPLLSLDHFQKLVQSHDLVVFSDYAKGALIDAPRLIQIAHEAGKEVLVDPKQLDLEHYQGADLIKPNQQEFTAMAQLLGSEKLTDSFLQNKGQALLERYQIGSFLITQGAQGMLFMDAKDSIKVQPYPLEVHDVTGAGDTVMALLAACRSVGGELSTSFNLCSLGAALAVSKRGTATITLDEILTALQGHTHKALSQNTKILSTLELVDLLNPQVRSLNHIVLTNGCFDVLHRGHFTLLQKAKDLGDLLIVAINTDASVKRLKGSSRPIFSLEDRLFALSKLECVDYVVSFDEDTPLNCLQAIKPDILAKGGDYQAEDIVGYELLQSYGGQVQIIPFVDGYSTTQTLAQSNPSDY